MGDDVVWEKKKSFELQPKMPRGSRGPSAKLRIAGARYHCRSVDAQPGPRRVDSRAVSILGRGRLLLWSRQPAAGGASA